MNMIQVGGDAANGFPPRWGNEWWISPLIKVCGGEKDQGIHSSPWNAPISIVVLGMIGHIAEKTMEEGKTHMLQKGGEECLEMHKGLVGMKFVGNKNHEFVNGQICSFRPWKNNPYWQDRIVFCWWTKSCTSKHPIIYSTGFNLYIPRWSRISSTNSIMKDSCLETYLKWSTRLGKNNLGNN